MSTTVLAAPLSLANLPSAALAPLADAIHTLLAQRQEDVDLRDALATRNRQLSDKLERCERREREEKEGREKVERERERERARVA